MPPELPEYKESSMYVHTVQLVGMWLVIIGLCVYVFHINSKHEKLSKKSENLDESFEKHMHCLTCGSLNNRCGCNSKMPQAS